MEKHVKKFGRRSFTSTLRVKQILKLLDAGNYPSKIARILGMSRQHVYYYVKKLRKLGYIEREVKDHVTFYYLTQKGKNYLDKVERGVFDVVVRLHNVVVKYPIVEEPKIPIEWRKVELQNWSQLIGRELGLTVRKNTDSIEIFCDSIEGYDPHELLLYAFDEANRLAEVLEQKFQMKLGRPRLSRKPHFAIKDPLAKHLGKFMEFSDDFGKMDESEGIGEFDLYDPRFVKNYLITFNVLPSLVRRQERELSEIKEILQVFAEGMREHMKLIRQLQETTEALRGIIEEIRKMRK